MTRWQAKKQLRAWMLDLLLLGIVITLIVSSAIWVSNPNITVAANSSNARRFLGSFWSQEQNESDIYRWAQPDAAIRLFGFEQRAPLLIGLRLSASRPLDQPLVRLTISGAGSPLELPLSREWRQYTLLVSAPARDAEGRLLALHSLVDPPYPDTRPLGFALSSMTVTAYPRTWADRLPNGMRVLFLVLLGLAAYVALRRRMQRVPAFAIVLGLAILLGLSIAFAPIEVGYWLPNLWFGLTLIWLALALPLIMPAFRRFCQLNRARCVWAGLLAVVGAQALLPLQQSWSSAIGWALLVGGCVALAAILPPDPPSDTQPPARRLVAAALTVITLVALALRLVDLEHLPIGMWRDEAQHGLLALRILHDPTFRPVYVPTIADIPALLFYLAAVPIDLFGAHAWTIRLVPALCGGLTPLALYFMARPVFGARVGLIAAGFLALSFWHISLSRLAFAATLGPPLTLIALGSVWRLIHAKTARRRLIWAALAGAATGVAVYTYHPSRLTPLVVALSATTLLGSEARLWRAALPYLVSAALAACVIFWPLAGYALDHRASFSQRVGQTSVFNADSLEMRSPAARVEENVRLNLGIWNARGDYIGRHNLPDAPQLDPIVGGFFAIGAALVLAWWRDRRARFILIWLGVGLIPGIFSIEAPHAVRTVEIIAPSMLLAGVGADMLLRQAALGLRADRYRRFQAGAIVVGALALLALNGVRYFIIWPAQPQVYAQFYVPDTHIGMLAQRLAHDSGLVANHYQLFIPIHPGSDEILEYLTSDISVGRFDGRALSEPPGEHALLITYGDMSQDRIAHTARLLGPGAVELGTGPRSPVTGRPEFIIYGRNAADAPAVSHLLAQP
jgi:4-amino-4-deoxy-L-arabinose transferase-like glycosyltransferase